MSENILSWAHGTGPLDRHLLAPVVKTSFAQDCQHNHESSEGRTYPCSSSCQWSWLIRSDWMCAATYCICVRVRPHLQPSRPWPPTPGLPTLDTLAWNTHCHSFFSCERRRRPPSTRPHIFFLFPLRQLCCSLSIVEASHFHMCVGHKKTAKRRLKASLSWPAGSQFASI